MKKIARFLLILMIAQPTFAIEDLPKSDPAYKAVQKTLKGGYLSLYNNNFNGNDALSRKEMAIAIDKLLKKMDQKGYNLSQAEIQELVQLSKSYKDQLRGVESAERIQTSMLSKQQKLIDSTYHDLSKINDELRADIKSLKKENDEQHLYMVIAIGVAAILGLAK